MQRFVTGLVFIVLFAATARADTHKALSQAERDGLMRQVAACWNTGSMSHVTPVTIAMKLNQNGTVQRDTLRLVGEAPTPQEIEAFKAAQRAVLRCEAGGYKLPLAKYDQWKSIEMTFDPERTHLK